MNSRLDEILHRQALLVARASAQRDQVAAVFRHLEGVMQRADTVVAGVRYLKARPLIPVAVTVSLAAVFAATRRYGAFHLFRRVFIRGFALWRTYRAFGAWIGYARTALLGLRKQPRQSKNLSGMQ